MHVFDCENYLHVHVPQPKITGKNRQTQQLKDYPCLKLLNGAGQGVPYTQNRPYQWSRKKQMQYIPAEMRADKNRVEQKR